MGTVTTNVQPTQCTPEYFYHPFRKYEIIDNGNGGFKRHIVIKKPFKRFLTELYCVVRTIQAICLMQNIKPKGEFRNLF